MFSSGGVKDQRVHSSEDLLLQETDDQLPDPTEHSAEVPVSTAELLHISDINMSVRVRSQVKTRVCITLNLQTSFLCCFCPFKEQEVHFYTGGTETSLKTLVSVPLLVCHVTENPERSASFTGRIQVKPVQRLLCILRCIYLLQRSDLLLYQHYT